MRISVDYDKTYTADPELWDEFIKRAHDRGHEVCCVTMRYPNEAISVPCEVVYTSREKKGPFMASRGRFVDVWIDDTPQYLW